MIAAVLAFLAFVFCVVATPVCRDFFVKRGWVDQPDEKRKLHPTPVPRSGGIGIFAAYFASLAVVYLSSGAAVYVQHQALLRAVLPATALVFLLGLADDLLDLKPRHKLLVQAIAAVMAVSLGARLSMHHGPSWLSALLSIAWLLACTNAVNLIDGMDGLATGVGLTATVTTLLLALLSGNTGLALTTAPLAGALLAFLRYNFAPASVFLGDSGSLTIGFLLGCLGLVWSGRSGAWGMLGPLLTLALPLLDVNLSIGRRFLRSVPIFSGDRGHIHHRVQDLGLSTRGAAFLLYGCCVLFAMLAVLQAFLNRWIEISLVLLFVAVVVYGIKHLGYVEFRAVRRTLSHGAIRRAVKEEIHLEEMRRALSTADTPEQCWAVVRRTCEELHITTVQMKLCGVRFIQHPFGSSQEPSCTVHVPLGEDSWLLLAGPVSVAPQAITAALQPIQLAMQDRLPLLRKQQESLRQAA